MKNKSLRNYYKNTASFNKEAVNTIKVTSSEDEVYVSLLARGDFTNDSIEDFLILSEWYARNAHGKHADLLILSKPDKDSAVNIVWRLNDL